MKRELDGAPHVTRVVLWDRFNDRVPPEEQPGVMSDGPLLESLGPRWRRAKEDWYDVYMNFTWQWRYAYRRREYVRSDA